MRLFLIIMPLLVITACAGAAAVVYRALTYHLELPEPVQITVHRGDSLRQITRNLEAHQLIVYPEVVEFYARVRGEASAFRAGEYQFSGTVTLLDVLSALKRGNVVQYRVALVEGETLKTWINKLHKHPKIKRTVSFSQLDVLREAVKEERENLEGLFFPDTYTFSSGDTDVTILVRAYDALQRHLSRVWANREPSLPYANAYELLTLASIVEKETALAEERPRIAGVFVSRLRKGMKLQTDPTVIYGLGDTFSGNLKRIHLRTDNPYNTYERKGLPPTPIAMVGLAALQAASQPTITGDLYFVAKGNGSHAFSKTYKQHARAVRQYQLKR
ncbi:MAG: endolytic transglycosylase MltG [Gammaproteobacteria bacterium]